MNIECPYCGKDAHYDTCDIGSSGDGDDLGVSCHHCDRSFLATLNVDVYLSDARKCDCLEDESLCEMEEKKIDNPFIDTPPIVYRKCKNCGREER
jgi:hypothetical protein